MKKPNKVETSQNVCVLSLCPPPPCPLSVSLSRARARVCSRSLSHPCVQTHTHKYTHMYTHTDILWESPNNQGCSPKTDSKTPRLKTTPARLTEHGDAYTEPSPLPSRVFLVQDVALYAIKRKTSTPSQPQTFNLQRRSGNTY